eukprot:CAMPEP_0201725304 /NCGR_PEP_ID=MMETSP0593-20130828/8741_1 /ASSEMBLY_ACC=CAM_ASM_000672 /TAXON_ID=267983 /ORGANISM="Skeletonema japonicum, Strain CCMP2506" /LENGTH=35 /DNA_ID= /DNA_START= /DNA_END= /DNA_ORIENTATION=
MIMSLASANYSNQVYYLQSDRRNKQAEHLQPPNLS